MLGTVLGSAKAIKRYEALFLHSGNYKQALVGIHIHIPTVQRYSSQSGMGRKREDVELELTHFYSVVEK